MHILFFSCPYRHTDHISMTFFTDKGKIRPIFFLPGIENIEFWEKNIKISFWSDDLFSQAPQNDQSKNVEWLETKMNTDKVYRIVRVTFFAKRIDLSISSNQQLQIKNRGAPKNPSFFFKKGYIFFWRWQFGKENFTRIINSWIMLKI